MDTLNKLDKFLHRASTEPHSLQKTQKNTAQSLDGANRTTHLLLKQQQKGIEMGIGTLYKRVRNVIREEFRGILFEAIHYADLELVKKLVNKNWVDVNCRSEKGVTPLMLACQGSDAICGSKGKIAKYLISKGADVDAVTDSNQTALIKAASCGHYEAVKALVEAGADPTIKDNIIGHGGYTALDFAKLKYEEGFDDPHSKIYNLLKAYQEEYEKYKLEGSKSSSVAAPTAHESRPSGCARMASVSPPKSSEGK